MGLEFKPYFWEDEEHDDRHVKCGSGGAEEKQTTNDSEQSDISEESSSSDGGATEEQQQPPRHGGLVFVHADGTPPAAPVAAPLGSNNGRELAPALQAVNGERREFAVLVASEEENVNEYKSFFSIVLDHPQFLGQGETKESALRQARTLLHYALGSMLLKSETIPSPSTGAELEVPFFSCFDSFFLLLVVVALVTILGNLHIQSIL